MSSKKLVSVSKDIVKKTGKHCLVLTLNNEGTALEGAGDCVWVNLLQERPDLMEIMTNAFVEAAADRDMREPLVPDTFLKRFPRLFAVPNTKSWKGVQIRTQLSTYLGFFGFGKHMSKRYGEGDPPRGWPVLLNWSMFKGPSRGCSVTLCSEIIFQLMEAQGLDPMDYGPEDREQDGKDDQTDSGDETEAEAMISPNRKRKRADNSTEDEESSDDEENRTQKKSKRSDAVQEEIAHRQQLEERNLSAFERRRRNVEEIDEGLKALGNSDENENL